MASMNHIGTHRTSTVDADNIATVTYCDTKVFHYDKETNVVTLCHAGFVTSTTKTRINQAATVYNLPFRVYSRKGEMFVNHFNTETPDQSFVNDCAVIML